MPKKAKRTKAKKAMKVKKPLAAEYTVVGPNGGYNDNVGVDDNVGVAIRIPNGKATYLGSFQDYSDAYSAARAIGRAMRHFHERMSRWEKSKT